MPNFLFTPAPNKDAIRFLADKAPMARAVFDGLLPELRGLAFTITGVESMAIVKKARDTIKQLPAGGDWNEIKKTLAADLVPYLGEEGGVKRAELLLRVHGYGCYNDAAREVADRHADVYPYWQWETVQDEKVRASHAALDGKVFPHDWTGERPTQAFGCRCSFIPLTADDVAEIRAADAKLPPAAHRVIDGERATRALANGKLETTTPAGIPTAISITDPRTKAGAAPGFYPRPGQLVDLPALRAQYQKTPEGAAAFAVFEQWAARQALDETGRTVMDWLLRRPLEFKTAAALLTAAPATVPVATAAALLAAEPASPIARALKLWGDDDSQFQEFITASDPAAVAWRADVDRLLRALQPYATTAPLYRGMFFKDAAAQAAFLEPLRLNKLHVLQRVATSTTKDLAVATRSKFFNQHGLLWEVRTHRTARDIEPLLAVLPTTKGEREVLLLGGTRLRLLAEETRPLLVDGQIITIPYLILEEI